MPCTRAGEFADLAFHVLALVPLRGPARLFDGRYVDWAKSHLPGEAWEPIVEDAPLIAELHARDPHALRLHALPALHATVAEMLACATRDLAALGRADVADPGVLGMLRSVDPTLLELVRTGMALVGRAHASARDGLAAEADRGCAAVAAALRDAQAIDPDLATARIEIAFALGSNGRAIADRLFAGCPAIWNAMSAELPVVIALHEQAVVRAGRGLARNLTDQERYLRSEWSALSDLDSRITTAPPALRETHARWRASLDLEDLTRRAHALGLRPLD